MDEELKACQCGEEADYVSQGFGPVENEEEFLCSHLVVCGCGMHCMAKSKDAVIAAWNTRPPDYLQMTVDYCEKHEIWFSVCTDGSLQCAAFNIESVVEDEIFPDDLIFSPRGTQFGTKDCYEWVIKTHTDIKEQ